MRYLCVYWTQGELQEARQNLTDKIGIGRSTELDKLVSRLTFVQCMYLISIYRLESLRYVRMCVGVWLIACGVWFMSCDLVFHRLEQNTKVFADIFLYLEDKGLHGELWGEQKGRGDGWGHVGGAYLYWSCLVYFSYHRDDSQ